METQQVKSAIYETCEYWVKILNMLTPDFFSEEGYFMDPSIDFGGNVNVQFFVTSSTELERLDIFISVNRIDDVGWEPFDEIEIEKLSFTQIEILPGSGAIVSGKMLYGEKIGELNVNNIANSLEEIIQKFDEVFPNSIENFKKIEQNGLLSSGNAPKDIKEFFKNNPAPAFTL
jgi:hypothetical protein